MNGSPAGPLQGVAGSRKSESTALGQRNPLLSPIPDDEMVMEAEIQKLSAVHQLPGQAKIFSGRGRISRWVVVDENEGGGPYSERRAQDFPRMHEGG
jgi:hypothetical protein